MSKRMHEVIFCRTSEFECIPYQAHSSQQFPNEYRLKGLWLIMGVENININKNSYSCSDLFMSFFLSK